MDSLELAYRIRRHGIEMTHRSNSSHIGSILSIADIIAVLYSDIMIYDSNNPKLDIRDRLILSKGHAGAAIYAALAETGYFSIDVLKTHCSNGSILSGHVSHKDVLGVELSTGSLGHGLSVGAGMALAAQKDNKKHRVYVILGDGECNEGSIWEAALFSSQYDLTNLIVIVDYNKMQGLGYCNDVISLNSLYDKWKSFGWNVMEIDGHNHEQLKVSLNINPLESFKPTVIIANTIKGKGVSFMEDNIMWHYKSPQGEDYESSLKELEVSRL